MTSAQLGGSRYALNLSLCLPGHRIPDSAALAALSGFDQVEMWWPFPTPRPTAADISQLCDQLRSTGTRLVCVNNDAGDFATGDRGLLSDPFRRDRCRDSIRAAIQIAAQTGCRLINLPYGNRITAVPESDQHRTAWDNLVFAAESARGAGVSVMIEPLNVHDNPDYLMPDLASAADLVDGLGQAGIGNAGILLDVYHLGRTEKDVETAIRRYAPDVLHVQFADLPDRRCPGTGELDFAGIHAALAEVGYQGLFGLEFAAHAAPDAAVLRGAQDFIRRYPGHTPAQI